MKRLGELLVGLPDTRLLQGSAEQPILGITADSRQVQPGFLFVAWRGRSLDGHRFIPEAIARGATAILAETPIEIPPELAYIHTTQARRAYALLCRNWFDSPQQHLHIVGITGTNGKSSTAYYLYQLWRQLGYRAGLIGTVFCKADEETLPASLTTPDSYELYRLLAYFRQKGITHVAMEVSSIALDQYRTEGLSFAGAVFTNLSHDHLDYHGTFTAYRDAKKRLFDGLSAGSFALTNVDDRHGRFMLQNTAARAYGYSLEGGGEFYLRLTEATLWGLEYRLGVRLGGISRRRAEPLLSEEVEGLSAALIGRFQGYNLLAAVAAAFLSKWEGQQKDGSALWRELARLSTLLQTLPGRLEPVPLSGERLGLVDYAHTPDAVEKVLRTLRPLVPPGGQLIVVIGAGGDRDPSKRAPMGKAAALYADRIILTSDNPRSEDPWAIIQAMAQGVPPAHRDKVLCLPDRREAIRTAIQLSPPRSLVAVLGKGHETYQEIQGKRYPFSDRAVLLELAGVGYAS
ncbi:MAG: UDP-N-acetylmuramoyl-L-alanyl-D-glutamate--2,6-diaminopimelate ligase [Bacteroidia bacterium]